MRARSTWAPYLWAAILTLLIAGPWLVPGYFFGTDWPGPRHLRVPLDFSSATPFDGVLAAVAAFISAEITAKLLILVMLVAGGLGALVAVPAGGFIPRAMASVIYVVNPFAYGRIHYGQLLLIAGYALFPWIAATLLGLMREPGWRPALILAVELTALGILDLHLLIPIGLLLASAAVAFTIWRRSDRRYQTELIKNVGLTLGATVGASLYWLIPLVTGSSSEGRIITNVGTADLAAFGASTDPSLGLIPNLLGLYGFWAEDTERFTSMKAFVPLWPVVLLVMVGLAALGVRGVIRHRPEVDFAGARPWVFALVGAAAVALILEMGAATPVTEPIVRFLDTVFPPYRGMRDAGKWGALIALVYAQLIPLGAIVVLNWVRKRGEVTEALAAGLLLALPLYYGNGLLFGSHGEIQPSQYPAGWYSADRILSADPHPGQTLFLPWHLYMSLDFVRNTNNVIASPAPSFFSVPVVISPDAGIPGVTSPADGAQAAVTRLVDAGSNASWAPELAKHDIKYVLLAHQVDWQQFQFLGSQPDLVVVADYGSIVLYRNLLWRGAG